MSQPKHTPGPWTAQLSPRPISSDDWCIGSGGGIIDNIAVCSERDALIIAAAPEILEALMEHCAECVGDGYSGRCPYYRKSHSDMCRVAENGTCTTWLVICKATGHDPSKPWKEVEK